MSDLFEVRQDGPVTILRLKPTDDLISTDLDDRTALLRVLYDASLAQQKVLLLEISQGPLGPSAVDRLWKQGRTELEQQPRATEEENLPLLIRVRHMYEKAIAYMRETEVVIVAAFEGPIDFDLLGLLLACDYRICSNDALLVNRVVERGVSPGNALLWYLSRSVGESQAMELLLEGRSLTASQARELTLVNRVTSPDDLYDEARAFAKKLAEKPAEALSTLLTAQSALHIGLDSYLEKIGVGFEHLPK